MRRILIRLLPESVKLLLRRLQVRGKWLRGEFIHDPRFEFYAQGQGRKNRAYHAQVKAAAATGRDTHLEPYHPRAVPKTLWMYWAQGEAQAPFIVKTCIESWRKHNPEWEIRVLDAENVSEVLDMSDVPAHLPFRFHADALRLRLLKSFGGVWTDVTVLCHRPLDDWLPLHAQSGFFAFINPGPDRWVDSWFIASEKGGALVTGWHDAYTQYVRRLSYKPANYFMVMYTFQWCIRQSPALREAWQRGNGLNAYQTFLLMSAMKGRTPMAVVKRAIEFGLPVSKLSWKTKLDSEDIEKILNHVDER